MPSAAIHQSVSKIINSKLKLNQDNEDMFFLGSVAPDCWRHSKFHGDKKKSHFSVECSINGILNKKEDYSSFIEKYKDHLNDPFVLGYLVHLITDLYWRYNVNSRYESIVNGQQVVKRIDGTLFIGDAYATKMFLYENDILVSIDLTKYYKLEKLKTLDQFPQFHNFIEELDISGLDTTINYANDINFSSSTKVNDIYEMNDIYNDIENCAKYVLNELTKIIN